MLWNIFHLTMVTFDMSWFQILIPNPEYRNLHFCHIKECGSIFFCKDLGGNFLNLTTVFLTVKVHPGKYQLLAANYRGPFLL